MTFYGLQFGRFRLGISANTPAYQGATTARRGKGFRFPGISGTAAAIGGSATLRTRARHLVRNNPWADNGVESWQTNCIGAGIRPRSNVADPDLRARIHDAWREWTDESDFDDVLGFYGQQGLAFRSMVESGEVFPRFHLLGRSNSPRVPFQVQLIEADQVPLHKTEMRGRNRIVAGVEFDARGKRVAYHMHRRHPGDPLAGFDGADLVRIPAERIAHVFVPKRPGDIRGVTWFASVMLKLLDLDGYDDAELIRKKTAALFAGFVIPAADEDEPAKLSVGQTEAASDTESTEDLARLEPGTMQVLEAGQDIKFSEPADVGGSYDVFMKTQLRAIAAGLGVTFEQLTGDLSDVNFSSIRAGLIEFRRRCMMFQQTVFNHQFNRRVWREWLRQAVLSGVLPAMSSAEFAEAASKVKWIGQGFEFVQPLHDQTAHERAVRSGWGSRSQVAMSRGMDPEELEDEIAADNERADGKGLVFDSDPRRVARSGGAQHKESMSRFLIESEQEQEETA